MRIIGNIFAGLTSLIYTVVLFAMGIALMVSNIFSPNYYTEILKNIDIKEIKLSDLGVEGLEGDMTIEEAVVDSLTEAGLSETEATKIVNNKKINEVVGEFLSETMTYMVDQKEVPQLDVNDVKEILETEEMSEIADDITSEMSAEELTNELNKYIRELVEGEVSYE